MQDIFSKPEKHPEKKIEFFLLLLLKMFRLGTTKKFPFFFISKTSLLLFDQTNQKSIKSKNTQINTDDDDDDDDSGNHRFNRNFKTTIMMVGCLLVSIL